MAVWWIFWGELWVFGNKHNILTNDRVWLGEKKLAMGPLENKSNMAANFKMAATT